MDDWIDEASRRLHEKHPVEYHLASIRDQNLTWNSAPKGGPPPPIPAQNPFDRDALPSDSLEALNKALEASRRFAKEFPNHLGYTQASRNLMMAYNLRLPPTAEELKLLMGKVWIGADIIIRNHFDLLMAKLDELVIGDWLGKIIEPRLEYLRSLPDKQRQESAKKLGIYRTALIDSGLVWATQGRIHGQAKFAGIGSDMVFTEDPLANTKFSIASVDNIPTFKSFPEALQEVLRDAINGVRIDVGIPQIGEGWASETEIFRRVQALLPNEEVIQHGKPTWLGRQHFDVWIPNRNIAIEYHGRQHFEAVPFFGGEAALADTMKRDSRKRMLSKKNRVRLIEINFDDFVTDEWLMIRLGL